MKPDRFLPAAFFFVLAVAMFPRLLAGDTFFHYDTWMQNLTFRAWWFDQLRAGHFATWCPGLFAGFPLFAETQTGPLYPPTFILFGLLPAPAAFSASVLLHFALAGTGMYVLARRYGAEPAAAVFAGAAFELSGFLVTHVVHFNLLTGAAWMPWALVAAEGVRRGRPRALPALAAVIALQLLGAHPYATLMTLALVGITWGLRSGSLPTAGRIAVRIAVAVVLAAGLAAVQIWPTQEFLARTPRADAVTWEFLT
ncbi:MAG: hypothetical protein HKN12_07440, partial [Gemmatimonadetes bacterium]|nr:hypothetical protein [Gemmatimonadota bacterium]